MSSRAYRSRVAITVVAVLGVAACVSLSSPKGGGGGNIPVVRGPYKPGTTQLVRIALATSGQSRVGATTDWAVFQADGKSQIVRYSAGGSDTVLRGGTIGISQSCNMAGVCTDGQPTAGSGSGSGPLIIRPLASDGFVTWNSKRYRGELVVSLTDSGALVVNRLPMDSYVRGVVPLEIGNRTAAEMAAVEAQAVAARTYSYKHLTTARAFDMYATVQDQVYGGVDAEKPQSDQAITNTADVVVLYNGQPITTPYHSTCGGSTAGVSEVWYDQSDEPYLRPVSDRIPGSDHFYCDASPRFSWTQSYDAAGLRAVMEKYLANYTKAPKSNLGRITDISEQGRTQSGRLRALTVQTTSGSYILRGNDIRFVLRDPKGAILNSTFINVQESKANGEVSTLTVTGRGYGHGIGMCQWGAIGRARAGQDFRTILETYYPGTTIGRIAG